MRGMAERNVWFGSYALQLRRLGLRIRKMRTAQGWTLEQAGAEIGMDGTQLQKIEAGLTNVTFRTLVKIGVGFGVSAFEFVGDPEQNAKLSQRDPILDKLPAEM